MVINGLVSFISRFQIVCSLQLCLVGLLNRDDDGSVFRAKLSERNVRASLQPETFAYVKDVWRFNSFIV